MTDDDTRQTVEETRTGYHVEIESKRGTGTRDQDKVRVELWSDERPATDMLDALHGDVTQIMNRRRNHQPDTEGDDE
jgi:hypothetical protein